MQSSNSILKRQLSNCLLLVLILILVAASCKSTIAFAQPPELQMGADTGKRAFVTREMFVPLKWQDPQGVKRRIPAGSVVKLFTTSAKEIAYDDSGFFDIVTDDYVVLTNNLPELLAELKQQDPFTREFASGNFYSLLNLQTAAEHFAEALKISPNDQFAKFGQALIQHSRDEQIAMLEKLDVDEPCLKALVQTHLAKLTSDFERLTELSKSEFAPQLVYLELCSFLLARQNYDPQPEADYQSLI